MPLRWVLLPALLALRAAAVPAPPIRIESGLVQGALNADGTVLACKGIPYAAPPVGELRWRAPQPAAAWQGVRPAVEFGASGVQTRTPGGRLPARMSEDCLFLNVWAPAPAGGAERRAVLFFIHGGAGVWGSGDINGAELAKQGILVVSVNFRLGLFAGFGHPELSAESPHRSCGNYGMLDLLAALGWVQRNIAAFGGDPARVTLSGQSSGAAAVHHLVASPAAKGLFRAAIPTSFPFDYLTKPNMIPFVRQKEANGVEYARLKGAASIADLRKIPALELIADDPAVTAARLIHLAGGIVRDGHAFPLAYPDALDQGLPSDVPTLTGLTADDFGPPAAFLKTTAATFAASLPGMFGEKRESFLSIRDEALPLWPVSSDEDARRQAKTAQLEYRLATVFHWARRRAKTGASPVFTYLFDHPVSPERGAYHGSDLAFQFNDPPDGDRAWTDADRRVAARVSGYWVNFVKTGNPNGPGLPDWPAFAPDAPVTMFLGASPGPRPIAAAERLPLYERLLDKGSP